MNRRLRFLSSIVVLILSSFSAVVFANEPTQVSGGGLIEPRDYFAQITVSLILVLLIIFVGAWLLRRYGRLTSVANGRLSVLGAVSVGQRERIMLVQVGSEQLLIGVTTSRISTLHKLDAPIDLSDDTPSNTPTVSPPSFAETFAARLHSAMSQSKPSEKP